METHTVQDSRIVCGACGHQQTDTWEIDFSAGLYDCERCGAKYEVVEVECIRYVTILGPEPVLS